MSYFGRTRLDMWTKRWVWEDFNYVCGMCGLDAAAILQIHHVDGDHNNPDVDNLMLLCPNCHASAHVKPHKRFDRPNNLDFLGDWGIKFDSSRLRGATPPVPADEHQPAGS